MTSEGSARTRPEYNVGERIRYRLPNGTVYEGEILLAETKYGHRRWLVTYPWPSMHHSSGYVYENEIMGQATEKGGDDSPWPGRVVPEEEL